MLCSRVLTPGSSAQRPVPHESVPGPPVPIPRQANKAWWYAALEVATKQRHGSPPPPPATHDSFLPRARHRDRTSQASSACRSGTCASPRQAQCSVPLRALSAAQNSTSMQTRLRPGKRHMGAGFAWRGVCGADPPVIARHRRTLHALATCACSRTVATRDSARPSPRHFDISCILSQENNF